MFLNFAAIVPLTACSRSASLNTKSGAFPPSSIEVRSTRLAACSIRLTPTPVEPVNDNLRSLESSMIGPITSADAVVGITFKTPLGMPRSSSVFAKSMVDSGVRFAGFTTMVQPAAIAGAILRVAIANGKFQGVISKLGPTGFLRTSRRFLPSGAVW